MPHSPADHLVPRRPRGASDRPGAGRLAAVAALGLAVLAQGGAALAQTAQPCAASSDTPRTAEEVIADVARQRCPAGSTLRAIMTIAGQAIVLQHSGTCERDGFRTMSRRMADGSRGLGVTCTIAAR